MSTHLFQIGDIVRINEPTLKQWAEIRTRGFHPVEISPYIGYLAVVVETWNSGEAVSDACVLRTCDEDYVFDPCGPFDGFDEDLDVLVNDTSPTVRKMVLYSVRPQDVEQLKNDDIKAIRKMADKATIVE